MINYFLKDTQVSIRISVVGNIISTIAAVPLLTFPILDVTNYIQVDTGWTTHGADTYSLWLVPVVFGFSLIKVLPTSPPIEYNSVLSDFPFAILLFLLAMIVSFVIEYAYAKIDFKYVKKSEPGVPLGKTMIYANIASYLAILVFLILLGLTLGLIGANEPIGFLTDRLFANRSYSLPELFWYIISYLFVLLVVLGVLAMIYQAKNFYQ